MMASFGSGGLGDAGIANVAATSGLERGVRQKVCIACTR